MKLSIRTKFFIVLLAFSLGPLFLSRMLMGKTFLQLSGELAAQTKEELNHIISNDLEANAVSLATIVEAQGNSMMLASSILAMQAGKALSNKMAPADSRLYFTRDFEDGATAPPATAPSQEYVRRTRLGTQLFLDVNFNHPAFLLSRDTPRKEGLLQARQLRTLQPVMKSLYEGLSQTSYWFNVGLENGVFMTYPGHGRFPMMFDYRDQRLYRLTRESGDHVWESPTIDPVRKATIASVGCPIFADNGTFMGVASVDVPISSIFGSSNLETRWQGDVRSFMVIRQHDEDRKETGLLIIAQDSSGKEGHRRWMMGIKPEWLESDDQEGFSKLLQLMSSKDSGVVELPYKGTDSVWAFSGDLGFRFVLITPKTVAEQLPNAIIGSFAELFSELRVVSAVLGGVMLLVTGLIAWFGSRAITRPILFIVKAARRLASGDFSARISMHTGDERDLLVDSFNEMGPKLEEHLRISKDLDLAQEVQKLLLPHSEPALDGYDLSGGIAYCDQTGGDYYDFIDLQSETGRAIGVVLGDVSGHGVPSALIMATARGQLHSLSRVPLGPLERISAINNFLSDDLDGTGRFLTLFYLRLEEGSSMIRWVRAGHDPAIRYTPATDSFSELGGEGLPLGVMMDFEFEERSDTLTSGEVLLLATDGVWEAWGADGEMFGKQRVLAIIRDNAHKSAEDIRCAVMDAVDVYQVNGQEDDIAVVVIKKV